MKFIKLTIKKLHRDKEELFRIEDIREVWGTDDGSAGIDFTDKGSIYVVESFADVCEKLKEMIV